MGTISFGADDRTELTDALLAELERRGFEVRGYGPPLGGREQWAEVGERVALDVVEGRAETGIACCYTGTGVSIAANKVRRARAALCIDAATTRGARLWNDANVLCLSLQNTRPEDVPAILDAWFSDEPVDESERANIARLGDIELFAQF
ncbi:MAG: RpiB/LacA/LacB family sugar-phosphate isomerase [Dehalococcoidia bacterium]|nr:RpiB/LacA/LacB family sugar-phosphate isomerase [Dehalococcoidia bacterium]